MTKKEKRKNKKKREKSQKTSIRISTQIQNLKAHRAPNLIPSPFLTKLSNLTLILLIRKLWPEGRCLPKVPQLVRGRSLNLWSFAHPLPPPVPPDGPEPT